MPATVGRLIEAFQQGVLAIPYLARGVVDKKQVAAYLGLYNYVQIGGPARQLLVDFFERRNETYSRYGSEDEDGEETTIARGTAYDILKPWYHLSKVGLHVSDPIGYRAFHRPRDIAAAVKWAKKSQPTDDAPEELAAWLINASLEIVLRQDLFNGIVQLVRTGLSDNGQVVDLTRHEAINHQLRDMGLPTLEVFYQKTKLAQPREGSLDIRTFLVVLVPIACLVVISAFTARRDGEPDMNYQPPRRSDGTLEYRREKLPWPADKPFRILSIDGGGIRGLFGAAYLAEIERRFLGGASIGDQFDMIAGTSTGGIIALGLAQGKTAKQISEIYAERGHHIFPPSTIFNGWWRFLRSLFRPKHRGSDLRNELLRVFGHDVLDAAKRRVVIPCFEGEYGEPFIYKTPHHPAYQKDRHKAIVDIALHTAAAPAYLAAVEDHGYKMLDGGLWANNPIMNAVVDVMACYDVLPENIKVLSIGTGENTVKIGKRQMAGGKFAWGVSLDIPILFRLAARAQSKNVLGQAYLLLGKPNVIRVDLDEREQHMDLDDVIRAKAEMPSLARAHAEANGALIQQMFLIGETELFTNFGSN